MPTKEIVKHIAAELSRLDRCQRYDAATAMAHIIEECKSRLADLAREFLPSGGGFDAGTKIDLDRSKPLKLVFSTSFHHMNDGGFYDGWTEHLVTITPTFDGFAIAISGRDRNGIKDYIADTFHDALSRQVEATFNAATKQMEYA